MIMDALQNVVSDATFVGLMPASSEGRGKLKYF